MTFSVGHVQNGTGAGWRRTRAKKYVPWACNCKHDDGRKLNPGYLVRCVDCRTNRVQ